MITIGVFALSGITLAILLLAKRMEEKRRRTPLVYALRAVARGDERLREWHHKAVQMYLVEKDRLVLFVTKKLPMHSRIKLIQFINKLRETVEKYVGDIRGSKLLKKSDGISEFFEKMSEVEKGNGEINEFYEERGTMDLEATVAEPELVIAEVAEELKEEVKEIGEEVVAKILKPRKPRALRVKKPKLEPQVIVVEVAKTPKTKKASHKSKKPTQKKKKIAAVEIL